MKIEKIHYFIIVFLLLNIFTWWVIFDFFIFSKHSFGSVSFLSVGQGDASLIKLPAGNILIDAGPNNSVIDALNRELPFYDRVIDLFILSHPSKDHYTGFFDILERHKVRMVMLNNPYYSLSSYQKLISELKKKNILFIKGEKGVKVKWDNNQNALLVVYPQKMEKFEKDPNRFSLILNLDLGKNSFIFTGDIGSKEEEKISPFLTSLVRFPAVLKVAHHGSKYSSSQRFLEALQPIIAVIPVGENSYGHPHQEVLERLKKVGADIFRTDLDGIIRFKIDKLGNLKRF